MALKLVIGLITSQGDVAPSVAIDDPWSQTIRLSSRHPPKKETESQARVAAKIELQQILTRAEARIGSMAHSR